MAVARDNFDSAWLGSKDPVAYTSVQHRPVGEVEGSREEILPFLAEAVVDHHSHRSRIAAMIGTLGFEKTKEQLDKALDLEDRAKMGNFGEVVASEHLIQRYGYQMPIFKLRYRDSKQPMRGEDIVAFRVGPTGGIDLVAIGEAKAVQSFAKHGKGAVTSALGRLTGCYAPHPQTLDMISEILYGMGRDAEGAAVDEVIRRIAAGAIAREHWIFLLTGDDPADPFGCVDGAAPADPPLICVNLSLADLKAVVEASFVAPSTLEMTYAP